MRNLEVADAFMQEGGCELAPCSTPADLLVRRCATRRLARGECGQGDARSAGMGTGAPFSPWALGTKAYPMPTKVRTNW